MPISRCRPSGSSAPSSTAAGRDKTDFVDASRLATALLGNSIGANIFLVGYAYQIGALPLSAEAIEKAIELNGEAVAMNQAAFRWGRRAALDLAAVEALAKPAARRRTTIAGCRSPSTRWSRGAWSSSPPIRMRPMRRATRRWSSARGRPRREGAAGKTGLAEAVARYLFKLMAYKDEYEVARLYTDGKFMKQVADRVRRRESPIRIPSRAAAAGAQEQGDRRAAQDQLRRPG